MGEVCDEGEQKELCEALGPIRGLELIKNNAKACEGFMSGSDKSLSILKISLALGKSKIIGRQEKQDC